MDSVPKSVRAEFLAQLEKEAMVEKRVTLQALRLVVRVYKQKWLRPAPKRRHR